MAEIYPLRASGELAGRKCDQKKCPRYARWAVSSMGMFTPPSLSCGQHLSVIIKGLRYTNQKAVIVQEIPGNWLGNGAELAAKNGETYQVTFGHERS